MLAYRVFCLGISMIFFLNVAGCGTVASNQNLDSADTTVEKVQDPNQGSVKEIKKKGEVKETKSPSPPCYWFLFLISPFGYLVCVLDKERVSEEQKKNNTTDVTKEEDGIEEKSEGP